MSRAPAGRGLRGTRRHGDAAIHLLALTVGVLAGAVGTAFHLAADWLAGWPRLVTAWLGIGPGAVVTGLGSAVTLTVAVYLVRRYAPEAAGSGIPEVEAALERHRPIRWRRVLPVKFGAGLLAQAAGLVAGREGPTIHMAACIAQAVDELWRLDEADRKSLLAAGAAAGLAAAFAAPVAAILFILEETRRQFRFTYRSYTSVVLATCASAVVTGELAGVLPDLGLATTAPPLALFWIFALLGAVLGAVGVAFNRGLLGALGLVDRVPARRFLLLPLALGLLLGVGGILLPAAVGPGDALIPELVKVDASLQILLMLAALRLAGALLSYPLGAPGGIFAPMLTLATTIGLALAAALALLLPAFGPMAPAMAVAAMGAMFTASVGAPLVGTVLVLELTGAFELALPVLIACIVAAITARQLGGRPIYEQLLARKEAKSGRPPHLPEAAPMGLAG